MKDGIARIGKVMDHALEKFAASILETRKGYNQTVFIYTASGDDSVPCKGDKVIILKVDGTGNFVGAGVLNESQGALPGEKIFYGREADGKITSKLSMLNNGDVKLEADGDYAANIKKDANVKIKGDITIDAEGDITKTGGGKYTIKAKEITLTGETSIILSTIGSAGWCPNGVPHCLMTAAPHGGSAIGITGLKGQ